MCESKASQPHRHRGNCTNACTCKAPDGSYAEAMPTDQGADAERLQAVLLGSTYKPREPSPATLAIDWFMRVVDWFGRIWSTCLSMMGAKR